MNTKLTSVARMVVEKTKANSPAILTGIGVAGVVTTTVLGAKATIKATRLVDQENFYRGEEGFLPMSRKETFKFAWKGYIPTAVMATATIIAIVGANSISSRRNAAIVGLYSLTESTLKEYQAKVEEIVGPEVAAEIKDKITDDKLASNPASEAVIIETGHGNTKVFEEISGRYFLSSKNQIDAAVNELNHRMMSEFTVTLNEFYSAVGLPNIKAGEELGWNTDRLIEISYNSKVTDAGEPVLVVQFLYAPDARFQNF